MVNNSKKSKMVDIIRPEKKIKQPQKIHKEPAKKEFKEELEWLKKEEFKELKEELKPEFKKEKIVKISKTKPERSKRSFKTFIAFLIVGFLIYLMFWVLPRVEINITTKKVPLELTEEVEAATDIENVVLSNKQIPAEIFSQRKNNVFSFPATAKKNVEQKAKGEVTIYNAYSSDNQLLVANTRLLAPDGKIFRLEKSIVVPGAKIIEGKIVPSSIKTTVIADKAGQEYNIGPVSRFTIPGFQGSEKYQGFYAKSDTSMSGGFIGEVAVPSEDDIKKAKDSAENSLKDYFNVFFYTQIPKDFKIIDGANQFKILKEEINESVDNQNNFSVFIEAEVSVIAFRQDDVLNIFSNLAKEKLGADFKLNNYEISYSNTVSDFNKKSLRTLVNFKGTFQPPFDVNEFKQKIIGKNEFELKTLIFSQTNIEKAKVSLWPFWVKRVPNDLKKIKIEVN